MAKRNPSERQSLKHTHKLQLIRYPSGYEEFFCTLPDCSYRVRSRLMVGKKSICWDCGKEFELTVFHMRRIKPKCINCIPIRESKAKPIEVAVAKKSTTEKHIVHPNLNDELDRILNGPSRSVIVEANDDEDM